ncbi:hypothetical protein FB451DRAFT_1342480 [Mycena latifolia]|nr:hypothetical protein FB451DRAFT_1342480 [Mycena latifolia]
MATYSMPPLDVSLYRVTSSFSFAHFILRTSSQTRENSILNDGDLIVIGRDRHHQNFKLPARVNCGTDVRKAASDGFPLQNIFASDLCPDFWTLGHELFQSAPDTCPIAFLARDVLDTDFIELAPPAKSPPQVPAPPLASLTRLTQLRGQIAAIHVSAVFHLFSEAQQLQLARALAGLLSPLPGSVIFGFQSGRHAKGFRKAMLSDRNHMLSHSPVSPEGTVKVDAHLELRAFGLERVGGGKNTGFLVWSVTRL